MLVNSSQVMETIKSMSGPGPMLPPNKSDLMFWSLGSGNTTFGPTQEDINQAAGHVGLALFSIVVICI